MRLHAALVKAAAGADGLARPGGSGASRRTRAGYGDGVRELDVVGVRVEMPSNNPIVLLRERDGDRYLPIWIGAPEASAIAFAQQGVVPPRPLTHDLLQDVIEALGRELEEVRITAIRDGVFHAELVFDGGLTRQLAARRTRSPSRCASAAGSSAPTRCWRPAGSRSPDEDEDEVEKFREFLDQISPEDFGEGSPARAPLRSRRRSGASRRSEPARSSRHAGTVGSGVVDVAGPAAYRRSQGSTSM